MLSGLSGLLSGLYARIHPAGDGGLVWQRPADFDYGPPLDEELHLCAEEPAGAAPGGVFKYSPPASTILPAGEHVLKVTYTPSDLKTNKKSRVLRMSHKITVRKATPHLLWKNPQPIYFGTQLSRKQLNTACTDLPGGEYTYSPPLRAVVAVGTQRLTVTFEPDEEHAANYCAATKTVEIVVIALRQPVFFWHDPLPIVYGDKLGPEQLNATLPGNLDDGVVVYEPPAGFLLNAGESQMIKVTFTPANKIEVASAEARVKIRVAKQDSALVWPAPANIYVGTVLSKAQLGCTCSNIPGGSFKYSHKLGEALPEGVHELTVEYTPDRKFASNYSPAQLSVSVVVMPLHKPFFTWQDPAPIDYLTPLGPEQLCARLQFPVHGFAPEFEYSSSTADWSDRGVTTYEPPLGAILGATKEGRPAELTVRFSPFDKSQVQAAEAIVRLVVAKADPVIEWTDPAPVLMHTLLSETQLNAVCTLPGPDGQLVYAPPIGTHLPVGLHTLAVTYLPSYQHKRNFNSVTRTVEISIEQPQPMMRWADPPSVHCGRPLTKKHLGAVCVEPGLPPGSGTFDYDPPLGTILPMGPRQPLRLVYTVAPEFQYSYQPAPMCVYIDVVPPRVPSLSWDPPKPIPFGAGLSQFQLNATCSVGDGFLYYDPPRGTILASGETHELKVTFMPDDHLEWASVSLTVPIFVYKTDPVLAWNPQRYFYAGMALTEEHLCCSVVQGSTFIEGTFSYKPRLGAILGAGTHTLTASFTCHKKHRREWNDVSLSIEFQVAPKLFPVVHWPEPEPIIYGARLSSAQLCASCELPGSLVYDPPLVALLDAGDEQQLSVTFHPVNHIEHNEVTHTVRLLVKKAVPALTWEPPPFLYIGTPLGPKHLCATSKQPGSWVYCPEMGEVLPLGKHTMTVVFKPDASVAHNWTFASSFVTMLVITEGSLFKMPQRYLEPDTHREFPVDDKEYLLEPDKLAYYSSALDCLPPEPVRKVVEKMKASKMLEKAKLERGELDLSWAGNQANSAKAAALARAMSEPQQQQQQQQPGDGDDEE